MEMFKNMLEVGDQAVIINVFHDDNRHLIGKVVTVEYIDFDNPPPDRYLSQTGRDLIAEFGWEFFDYKDGVIVTGVEANDAYIPGISCFNKNHLMPLGKAGNLDEMFSEETNPYLETV